MRCANASVASSRASAPSCGSRFPLIVRSGVVAKMTRERAFEAAELVGGASGKGSAVPSAAAALQGAHGCSRSLLPSVATLEATGIELIPPRASRQVRLRHFRAHHARLANQRGSVSIRARSIGAPAGESEIRATAARVRRGLGFGWCAGNFDGASAARRPARRSAGCTVDRAAPFDRSRAGGRNDQRIERFDGTAHRTVQPALWTVQSGDGTGLARQSARRTQADRPQRGDAVGRTVTTSRTAAPPVRLGVGEPGARRRHRAAGRRAPYVEGPSVRPG